MCSMIGCAESCDSEQFFLKDLMEKVVKKVAQDFSKGFFSNFSKNKSRLGFLTPTGMPGEKVEGFWGHAGL